jgi:hypothetical protein
VINFVRGRIFALKDGQAEVKATYTDKNDNQKQVTFQVNATTFPLIEELFNPDIWENGTFDETTRTLRTGPWGFGGWQYNGIDLSEYKYLVARLGSANNASVDFRIFDGPSYWGSPAIFSFGNSREVVVNLENATKDDGNPLNTEHIYIAGFWSSGSNPFVIDTVFLTNSVGIVDENTSIDRLKAPGVKVLSVHYFTLTGQKVQNIENKTGIFIEKRILSNGKVLTEKIQKYY